MKVNRVMKSFVLFIAMFFIAPIANAEWIKVFENIRGTTSYVDTDSIQASGQYRKVWELQNYKTPASNGMLSMKMRKEYDCKEEMTKLISFTAYKGIMGRGDVLGTVNSPDEWQPISKNPGGKGAFRYVCENGTR